jgi:predicted regulator of Ras-like GTPase activity (Roadblock/LC7/MglB family)
MKQKTFGAETVPPTSNDAAAINSDGPFLKGCLSLTNVSDLLQFLSSSYKNGMIQLTKQPEKADGKIFFRSGELVNVITGTFSGLDAFLEVCNWHQGDFQFHPDVIATEKNIGLPVHHALMEAAVLHDQRLADVAQRAVSATDETRTCDTEERSNTMISTGKDSTEVLNELLGIPGIDAVVVVGRDGFVIESAGNSSRVNIDELGASLAHAINGIEEMGGELKVNGFQDLFIEYGKAVIMCKPVGDAIAAVITPDASKLGIIRHKTKKHFEELALSY